MPKPKLQMTNKTSRYVDISTSQRGAAILAAVVFLMFIGVSVALGTASLSIGEAKTTPLFVNGKQGYYAAESGLEDVVHRLRNNKMFSPTELLTVGTGTATTTTIGIGGNKKEITSAGYKTSAVRNMQGILTTGVGANFSYGVQVGNGGILAENTSQIIGSVYSSGNVVGNNSASITGDVFVATTSSIDGIIIGGNARAHNITNATIAGSASSTTNIIGTSVSINSYADSIIGSSIIGDAYYFTMLSGTSVGGGTFPSSPPPSGLPVLPLPITDEDIEAREQMAESGGVYSGQCPYRITSGTVPLGPIKIPCDFEVSGTARVIINGPIWVAGNIDLKNNAIIELSSSYLGSSEMFIANNRVSPRTSGIITIQNSAQLVGSGDPDSYLVVVSMNNDAELGGTTSAINPKNNADASVYYAPHGKILIQNSSELKEATAYVLHLKNSATVTYESGVANINFSSGPTGGWKIDSWGEIE